MHKAGNFIYYILFFALALSLSGLARSATDYEVKAAYLYNFIKFVHWDRSAHAEAEELNLCVLGKHPFRDILRPLSSRKIQKRKLNLTYLTENSGLGECQVLFVSSSEKKQLQEILKAADDKRILTVSDIKGFIREGGVIGFVSVGNVIRFEVNLGAARKASIHLSSKLLELAEEVIR